MLHHTYATVVVVVVVEVVVEVVVVTIVVVPFDTLQVVVVVITAAAVAAVVVAVVVVVVVTIVVVPFDTLQVVVVVLVAVVVVVVVVVVVEIIVPFDTLHVLMQTISRQLLDSKDPNQTNAERVMIQTIQHRDNVPWTLKSPHPNQDLDPFSRFCRCRCVTDRLTHHHTTGLSSAIGHIPCIKGSLETNKTSA